MPAYFMVDILEITDEDKMEEYRSNVVATVARYGGTYRVLGGQFEVVEGDWNPTFPVMIEFPTMEKLKEWYNSKEYGDIKELRLDGTQSNAVFFEGLP